MSFRPDILVTASDSPRVLLVVETKTRLVDPTLAEKQIKQYMQQMSCPVGLLITLENIFIYKDRYLGHSEESVDRMGPFPVPRKWEALDLLHIESDERSDKRRPGFEFEFEEAVKLWLERIRTSNSVRGFSPEAEDAINSYVLPALSAGVIRGTGPRESLSR
jgi:hypothetical protein